MLEEDKFHIRDCIFSIDKIEEYVIDTPDLESFESNSMLHDAVLMHFVVIGQATDDMSPELKEANPQVDWANIKSFRNYIAHDYFGIDLADVWSIIKTHLPKLKEDMNSILKKG